MERWKLIEVEGLPPHYEVSTHGRVRNARTRKIIKAFKVGAGYLAVNLTAKHIHLYVHRLVVEAFLGGFNPIAPHTNHKDGDKTNNHFHNLERTSVSRNLKHKHRVLGWGVHNTKLDRAKASEIRMRYKAGGISQKKLGEMYGVSAMTVNRLLANKQLAYGEITKY